MKRDPAIDAYLAKVPAKNRALLVKLRKQMHEVAPDAEECISYKMPAFRYQGRVIGGFQARSSGCSYYPFSGRTLTTLAREVEGFSKTKSALHFGPEKPLSLTLLRKLVKARIAELRG